jgi:hypothetical protein
MHFIANVIFSLDSGDKNTSLPKRFTSSPSFYL